MIMKKNVLPVFQKLERMAVYAGRYFLKNAGSEVMPIGNAQNQLTVNRILREKWRNSSAISFAKIL